MEGIGSLNYYFMFGRKEEFLVKYLLGPTYNTFVYTKYIVNRIINKDFRRELKRNKKYYNIHDGNRCFILGNGPSLKNQKLSFLKDEIVFSVNFFMKSDLFETVHPDYHIFADPVLFLTDSLKRMSHEKLLQKAIDINPDIIFFMPFEAKSNFKNEFPYIKPNYYSTKMILYDNSINKVNLAGLLPAFHNVLVYAIYIAIYMGFKEINLLGADMTSFLSRVNSEDGEKNMHVYGRHKELTEKRFNTEFYLKTFGKTMENFRYVHNYAKKNGIIIINATESGILDVFPRNSITNM